jgi:hypothetical protein
MKQSWEYYRLSVPGHQRDQYEKLVNEAGAAGWEMVTVVKEGFDFYAFFKRQK